MPLMLLLVHLDCCIVRRGLLLAPCGRRKFPVACCMTQAAWCVTHAFVCAACVPQSGIAQHALWRFRAAEGKCGVFPLAFAERWCAALVCRPVVAVCFNCGTAKPCSSL